MTVEHFKKAAKQSHDQRRLQRKDNKAVTDEGGRIKTLYPSRLSRQVDKALRAPALPYAEDAGGNVVGLIERGKTVGGSRLEQHRDPTGKVHPAAYPLGHSLPSDYETARLAAREVPGWSCEQVERATRPVTV